MLPAFHSIQHMNMNKIIPMIATLSLGISLLGSCAFTKNYSGSEDDRTRAQAKTVGTGAGAAIGGGTAFGIAKLFGANNKTAGLIAGAGALIGGYVGYHMGSKWGDSIVRERAAYRSQEEYLQANIKQSQKRIKDLNKENRHLSKSIASLKTEKQKLKSSHDAMAIKNHNESIKQGLKDIDYKMALLDKDIRTAKQAVASSPNTQEVNDLKEELSKLQSSRKTYSAQRKDLKNLSIC